MLKKELQANLFKIIIEFENMYKSDYFDHLKRTVKLFSNYEFSIDAEIITQKETNNKDNIKIDFIEGAEPFTLQIPNQEIIPTKYNTIVKIYSKGFSVFPGIFYKSGEGSLLKENFKKFREDESSKNLKELQEIVKQWKLEGNEEKINELISEIKSWEIKEDNIISKNKINKLIVLDISRFYLLNELLSAILLGGTWYHIVLENDYYYSFPTLKLLEDNSEIKLYGDASLLYEGKYYRERIIELNPPWKNMINYELRRFHNGIYCPIDKLEYIQGLSYSIPVKETLKKLVDYIETLPFSEMQTSCVNEIIKEFEEKGFYKKEDNEDLKQMKEAMSLLSELYPDVKDLKKMTESHAIQSAKHLSKVEASSIQTAKKLSMLLNFQDMPDFVNFLDNDFKKRYESIHRNINMIRLPIVKEGPTLYIDIVAQLGRFVSNVLTYVFLGKKTDRESITISNFAKKDIVSLKKLQEEESNYLTKYSENYGKLYNSVRKDIKPNINFEITKKFIDDSHKVLYIALNNKELFN